MANLTQPTDASVEAFRATVDDPRRREDAVAVTALMRLVTGAEPVMWGPSMIGFGQRHYAYESGREGDIFVVGLSPRKGALTLYGIHDGYAAPDPLLDELGPHTLGTSCVYVTRLSALDDEVLERLVRGAWERRA